MKIKPGDKIVIVNLPHGDEFHWNGTIGTAEEFCPRCTLTNAISHGEMTLTWHVETCDGQSIAVAERYMRKLDDDDNRNVVSWDSCPWKPTVTV